MTEPESDFYSTPTGKTILLNILKGFYDPQALN
jgi:hypothetical protein